MAGCCLCAYDLINRMLSFLILKGNTFSNVSFLTKYYSLFYSVYWAIHALFRTCLQGWTSCLFTLLNVCLWATHILSKDIDGNILRLENILLLQMSSSLSMFPFLCHHFLLAGYLLFSYSFAGAQYRDWKAPQLPLLQVHSCRSKASILVLYSYAPPSPSSGSSHHPLLLYLNLPITLRKGKLLSTANSLSHCHL